VLPEKSRCELNLHAVSRLIIRLMDRGVPVLMPSEWWWAAKTVDAATGVPDSIWTCIESGGMGVFQAARSGQEVRLPAIPGFRTPRITIDLEAKVAEGHILDVDLVRK
jgi:hypothetical protein